MFGLSQEDLDKIQSVLKHFQEVEEALIIGSRAMGNFKKGSDIDIVLKGDISFSLLTTIKANLETLSLPYFFDVIHYESVSNPPLRKHIDTFGQSFYSPEKNR